MNQGRRRAAGGCFAQGGQKSEPLLDLRHMTPARSNLPLSVLCVVPAGASAEKLKDRLATMAGWDVTLAVAETGPQALPAPQGPIRDLGLLGLPLTGAGARSLLA